MNLYYVYGIYLLHDIQRLSDIVELGFNFVYRLWFYDLHILIYLDIKKIKK